ncbi:DUF3828 domain-containing protein [Paraburkholderia gardini]|uniref:DUF3828 domain-containing protein n=1 Tax=Paraburkholderia gardini TaxID=2823469 RepID=A0ABM8UA10_9BURK|nr:DUF3828 domain-containing protein [Paraburkholderia gardini]CAG4921127.1 hypothetical protein R54767_04781 [Paraburkholderia gardini]
MKKLFSLAVSVLLLVSGLLCQHAALADSATPESTTRAFYAWYIKLQSDDSYPLLNNGIYTYVSKATVDALRSAWRHDRLPGDSDYFTKVQDCDEQDGSAHIATHRAVVRRDVAVVCVTFGSKDKTSVLVSLRKQGGTWRIIKVDDTPEAAGQDADSPGHLPVRDSVSPEVDR